MMDLKDTIRVIEDFPKPGISFKDITTMLKDPVTLKAAIEQLQDLCTDLKPDLIISPESRGFIVGVPLAMKLGAGFVPVRKPGRLPAETVRVEYELEYGTDCLEMHRDAVSPGQTVLLADDLLATGGTMRAVADLVASQGGEVIGCAFLVELTFLEGRSKLNLPVRSVVQY